MPDASVLQSSIPQSSISCVLPPARSPQQLMQAILRSGRITALDRQWLLQAGLSELQLSAAELEQLRLIHDRLRMGLIKIIDS